MDRECRKSHQDGNQRCINKSLLVEENKLQLIVQLIQKPRVNKAEVMTLETLIVTDVHSKDVTANIMKNKVSSIKEFE